MKILLLEDDLLEQVRFYKTIENLNEKIDLSIAKDGREGFTLLMKETKLPDIILIDLHMPGQNGLDFLKELKENSKFKLIPAIAFSTSKNPEEIKNCYENGIASFVQKPIKPYLYKETVKLLITYWKLNVQ